MVKKKARPTVLSRKPTEAPLQMHKQPSQIRENNSSLLVLQEPAVGDYEDPGNLIAIAIPNTDDKADALPTISRELQKRRDFFTSVDFRFVVVFAMGALITLLYKTATDQEVNDRYQSLMHIMAVEKERDSFWYHSPLHIFLLLLTVGVIGVATVFYRRRILHKRQEIEKQLCTNLKVGGFCAMAILLVCAKGLWKLHSWMNQPPPENHLLSYFMGLSSETKIGLGVCGFYAVIRRLRGIACDPKSTTEIPRDVPCSRHRKSAKHHHHHHRHGHHHWS